MAIFSLLLVLLAEAWAPARAEVYPTNLLHFTVMNDFLPKGKPIIQSTNLPSASSRTNYIPMINFNEVPMLVCIENLSQQGRINYLIDPHYRHALLGRSSYHPGDEIVNLRLEDTSIEDTFTTVLKPRGFVMLDDSVSGISLITSYSHRPYVLDGTLLHMEINNLFGTNGIFNPVNFDAMPVDLALSRLITASGLNIKLSREVTNDVNWAIYLHADGVTAKQELYAVCQACEFEIVQDDTGQMVIRPKTFKHLHHVYLH